MSDLWPYVRGDVVRSHLTPENLLVLHLKYPERNFLYEIHFTSLTLPKRIEVGDAVESNAYHLFFYMIARFYFFDNGGEIIYYYPNKKDNYLSQQAFACLPPRFKRELVKSSKYEYIEMPGCFWCKDSIEESWIYSYVRDLYKHIWESVPQVKGKYSYISRNVRECKARRLLNESELIEPLKRAGFSIYTMEHMTFEDQIRLFRSSEVITGLHGAGLSWLIFCHPGTLVLEIKEVGASDSEFKRHYQDISMKCGLLYYSFTVAQVPDKQQFPESVPGDCLVDPSHFLNILNHLLRCHVKA